MRLWESLGAVAEVGHPDALDSVRRAIDPAWIEEALAATGTATLRRRRLPAEQVIWLVLGMALYRDRSIVEVCAKLDLALPARSPTRSPTRSPAPSGLTVSCGAIPPARNRVGPEPLEWLFGRTASEWAAASAERHRWRGLALYAIDGTTMRVPDTPENRAHFGSATAGGERGESGYPLLRSVALMALRSHLIEAVRFGPYTKSEYAYALDLLSTVPAESLTILDRNFLSAEVLIGLREGGLREGKEDRHWLVRAKSTTRWKEVEKLAEGEWIVDLGVSREARKANPALPKTHRARAIAYQREGHKPQLLLTSLLDAERYPATEIIALYHERWEIELGYDELKTELLESEVTLRSKSVRAVEQEVWGLLLAYNLVRLEMERVAEEAQVDPTRISFVASLRLIRDEWLWCAVASPGAVPRHLRRLRQDLKYFILPERRSHRSYPRAVKVKMSSYPRKRPQPPKTDELN